MAQQQVPSQVAAEMRKRIALQIMMQQMQRAPQQHVAVPDVVAMQAAQQQQAAAEEQRQRMLELQEAQQGQARCGWQCWIQPRQQSACGPVA